MASDTFLSLQNASVVLNAGPQRGHVLVEWRVVRVRTRAFDGLDLGSQRLRARAEIFHRLLVRLGWLFIGTHRKDRNDKHKYCHNANATPHIPLRPDCEL